MKLQNPIIFKILIIFIFLSLASCVATVGPSIKVSKIPLSVVESSPMMSQSSIAIGDFIDKRILDYDSAGQGLVTPEGDMSSILVESIREYLNATGAKVTASAPIIVQGEIKEWQSSYEGSTTGSLNSIATIYVEIIDQNTKSKLFSGNFKGIRSSHFPFVTSADIQDSLGFAMSHSIEQIFKDQKVQNVILSK